MGDYSLPPPIYEGAQYTLNPGSKYGSMAESLSPYITGMSTPAGSFSAPSNPQTSNQIQAVSQKISTGLRNIEVSGVSLGGGPAMTMMDAIPKQQFKEINRLKKLAGVELTFHGPLVEPTGIGRGGWDEGQRQQAEREMISAVERAHDLDPKGNIIVTFHSSNGLPEPKTVIKDKNGNEVIENISIIDESTGQSGQLPRKGINYFGGEKSYDPEEDLKRFNEQRWSNQLNALSIEAQRAQQNIRVANRSVGDSKEESDEIFKRAHAAYQLSVDNPGRYEQFVKDQGQMGGVVKALVNEFTYSKANAEEAYVGLRDAYNQVMSVAQRDNNQEMQKQLEAFRNKIVPHTETYSKNPAQLEEFVDEISKGIRFLQSITKDNSPEIFCPLEKFAIRKASDTFSNVALNAYKKFGEHAPIVSIENPPVGLGLTRADELKKLVEASQEKLQEKLMEQEKLSKKEAERKSKELIGVTWDVGHINMLRKYGFDDKDLVKQTETIAEFVKHIHLSDNFGLDHTELPMGMGNVPIKAELKAIEKELGEKYFKKVKQVIETGDWFRNFNNVTPFAETLEAFGSPIYGMKMAPYWNRTRATGMGYFSGYGRTLPDVHFSTYGAGFSSLPSELGGQIGGGRSRLSGTPNE